jgi:hypothetical protein
MLGEARQGIGVMMMLADSSGGRGGNRGNPHTTHAPFATNPQRQADRQQHSQDEQVEHFLFSQASLPSKKPHKALLLLLLPHRGKAMAMPPLMPSFSLSNQTHEDRQQEKHGVHGNRLERRLRSRWW